MEGTIDMAIDKDVLDQLLAGRDPQELFAKDGLLDELKKALSERMLSAELDAIIVARGGPPLMIVSDNGTELTSLVILRWTQERPVEWHYIAPASRSRTAMSRASTAVCVTNASTRRCSCRSAMPARCCGSGETTTTTCDRMAG